MRRGVEAGGGGGGGERGICMRHGPERPPNDEKRIMGCGTWLALAGRSAAPSARPLFVHILSQCQLPTLI